MRGKRLNPRHFCSFLYNPPDRIRVHLA
ncbi:hypothetical protein CY0110_19202 [Crocosphaera chwakensis CCY0110]|uniref:Uncharacterized protein n=1 Tax=Crocosphaera chwakensis CCY0110 TaxID=391612 RepID=A3IJH2_9CHRO|nr:hypothetical protein CY0110_19202 [Crocosphaera chwakensis CCY0110]